MSSDITEIVDMDASGDPTSYAEITSLDPDVEPRELPDPPGVREGFPELSDGALNDALRELREQALALSKERARTRDVAHAAADESVLRAKNWRAQLLNGWVGSIRAKGYGMNPPVGLGDAEAGSKCAKELHALIDQPDDFYTSRSLAEIDKELAALRADMHEREGELQMRPHRRRTATAKAAQEQAETKMTTTTTKGA